MRCLMTNSNKYWSLIGFWIIRCHNTLYFICIWIHTMMTKPLVSNCFVAVFISTYQHLAMQTKDNTQVDSSVSSMLFILFYICMIYFILINFYFMFLEEVSEYPAIKGIFRLTVWIPSESGKYKFIIYLLCLFNILKLIK
jgi:hypothetical protein